ncbi:MAG: hypothetical protein ACRCZ1_01385, partial [Cetobacterium sp.]
EFQQNLISEQEKAKKRDEKQKKIEEEQKNLELETKSKLENRDKILKQFETLHPDEKQKIEEIVYNNYTNQAGVGSSKIIKIAFEKAKRALIAEYLENIESSEIIEIFEPNKVVELIEEKIEKSDNTFILKKQFPDLFSFKFEAFGYLDSKISMETLKRIMSFLNIESYFKTDVEGYTIELKFVENNKSLIFIAKL